MPDPDSWPILQTLLQLAISLLFLVPCTLYAGVLAENSSQKENNGSGIGISLRTVSALLLCLLFAIWSAARCAQLVSWLSATIAGESASLYYILLTTGYLLSAIVIAMLFVLLPFSWGRAHSDRYEKSLQFMKPFCIVMLPLAGLITMPARKILSARGVASEIGSVTEEDLLEMVDSAEENSFIDESQKEMIGNIFELDEVTADDIMTHRTEIEAVPVTATVDDIIGIAVEFGYSRIPVYDGTLDNITGIAYVKDLLPYVGKGTMNVDLSKLFRPTLFVPESRRARELLIDFKQKKIQVAVVVDEYGGTAGIVTMEDILESIVGDIEDEYDDEDLYILESADGSLICDGYAEVEDVFEALGIDDVPEDVESDTIGGLLTDLLARIPKKNEHPVAYYGDIELTALDADERRITSVQVVLAPPEIASK